MNEERYTQVKNSPDNQAFMFTSVGRHGNLLKVVVFDEFPEKEGMFNLALGTLSPNGEADFHTTTNNGDRNKILVTVADVVEIFLNSHPGVTVYISGSDSRRTLLYQRAIAYAYEKLIRTFIIYGQISVSSANGEFELFDKGKNYYAFLIKKK